MKLFNDQQKISVGYFEHDSLLHKSMEQPFEKIAMNDFGCPSVGAIKDRIFQSYPAISIEVEFGFYKDEPIYNYNILGSKQNDLIHNIIKDRLNIQETKSGKCVLQYTDSKILVTDHKDLEVTVLQPQENIDKENCVFISGSFNLYAWLRPLNSAFIQVDPNNMSKVVFNIDKPLYSIFFNKAVDLQEIEPNKKVLTYLGNTYGITQYQSNIKRIFPKILKKRPKEFLI